MSKKQTRSKKQCLKCDKAFLSKGCWNRLCTDCHSRNKEQRGSGGFFQIKINRGRRKYKSHTP